MSSCSDPPRGGLGHQPLELAVHDAGEILAPSIAYGNTVVWAPAPTTSVCAVRLAECLEAADLPTGVVNLVTGPDLSG